MSVREIPRRDACTKDHAVAFRSRGSILDGVETVSKIEEVGIVACPSRQLVVTCIPCEPVVPGTSGNRVTLGTSPDHIVSGSADDLPAR